MPVTNIRVMKDIVAQSVSGRRFQMLLIGIFAASSLALVVVGIYGVISYSVSQRTHEIGLHMALGAVKRDALMLVLREGMTLAGLGIVLGAADAFAIMPLLNSLLYGVSAADATAFILFKVCGIRRDRRRSRQRMPATFLAL